MLLIHRFLASNATFFLPSIMPVNFVYQPSIVYYCQLSSMDKTCASDVNSSNNLVHLWVNQHLLYKPYKFNQQQMCIHHRQQEKIMHGSDPDPHGYNCPCPNCQSKFGSLPLLVEGIETQQHQLHTPETQQTIRTTETQQPIKQRHETQQEFKQFETPQIFKPYEIPPRETRQQFHTTDTQYFEEPLNLTTPSSSASHTVTTVHATEPSTSAQASPLSSTSEAASTSGSKSRRKVIKCSECDKVFTHRGDYNKHTRRHSGEKPYECPVCKKMFSHTSNLTRHLRVHSGDRPFKCENCGKPFARKDKLEAHMTTVICKKRAIVNKQNM